MTKNCLLSATALPTLACIAMIFALIQAVAQDAAD